MKIDHTSIADADLQIERLLEALQRIADNDIDDAETYAQKIINEEIAHYKHLTERPT